MTFENILYDVNTKMEKRAFDEETCKVSLLEWEKLEEREMCKDSKMKKIKVRCREGISECFKIDQMYGVLTKDNDIHVNGSVEVVGTDYDNIKRIKCMLICVIRMELFFMY